MAVTKNKWSKSHEKTGFGGMLCYPPPPSENSFTVRGDPGRGTWVGETREVWAVWSLGHRRVEEVCVFFPI